MNGPILLAVLLLLAAVGSLGWGLYAMGVGGQYDEENSERLMVSRLTWHGLAVAVLVFGYFVLN